MTLLTIASNGIAKIQSDVFHRISNRGMGAEDPSTGRPVSVRAIQQ
jgi:hypothetical protein